jgi:hypothetical protein
MAIEPKPRIFKLIGRNYGTFRVVLTLAGSIVFFGLARGRTGLSGRGRGCPPPASAAPPAPPSPVGSRGGSLAGGLRGHSTALSRVSRRQLGTQKEACAFAVVAAFGLILEIVGLIKLS